MEYKLDEQKGTCLITVEGSDPLEVSFADIRRITRDLDKIKFRGLIQEKLNAYVEKGLLLPSDAEDEDNLNWILDRFLKAYSNYSDDMEELYDLADYEVRDCFGL